MLNWGNRLFRQLFQELCEMGRHWPRITSVVVLSALLIGIVLTGCVPTSPMRSPTSSAPTPDETPKTVIVEPLPPEVETVSSLKVNVDQSSPDELVLSFEYYEANQQRVIFADLENTVVVEIDGKTIDGEPIKVLSSQTIIAPIIYSSEDSIVIPTNLLNLEGVDKDNFTARVHIKGDKMYVFGEAVFSLGTVSSVSNTPPQQSPTPTPAPVIFTLSTSVIPVGAGSISPASGSYQLGDRVTVTATALPGYRFASWSGEASGTVPTVTITMNSDKNVIANFEKIRYSLSTSVSPLESGSVSPTSGTYEVGTQVTLTAIPASSYRFTSWSGDVSDTSPTITIEMDSDKNIIANFAHQYVWVGPVDVTASGYTVWGGTWYTGPPSLAIDGNKITAWTLNDMGEITFDLGSERLIGGIEAHWDGHVTNGNTVNVYVDGQQVLSNEQFRATSNIRYFTPVRGRFVKYQTVALPHNEYLQIATWSEIAEFKVFVEE